MPWRTILGAALEFIQWLLDHKVKDPNEQD